MTREESENPRLAQEKPNYLLTVHTYTSWKPGEPRYLQEAGLELADAIQQHLESYMLHLESGPPWFPVAQLHLEVHVRAVDKSSAKNEKTEQVEDQPENSGG